MPTSSLIILLPIICPILVEYVFVNAEEERLVLKKKEKPKMMNYNLLSNPHFASLPVPTVDEEVKKVAE